MRFWVLAVAAGLVLAGCQFGEDSFYNAPKALDKMSPSEVCDFYHHYMSNPDLSDQARAITMQQLKAKGCSA